MKKISFLILLISVSGGILAQKKKAKEVAHDIASSSTLVVEGVKEVMRYCEGKPMDAGLNYVCVWNSSFLASNDFDAARNGFSTRTKPVYNANKGK